MSSNYGGPVSVDQKTPRTDRLLVGGGGEGQTLTVKRVMTVECWGCPDGGAPSERRREKAALAPEEAAARASLEHHRWLHLSSLLTANKITDQIVSEGKLATEFALP